MNSTSKNSEKSQIRKSTDKKTQRENLEQHRTATKKGAKTLR